MGKNTYGRDIDHAPIAPRRLGPQPVGLGDSLGKELAELVGPIFAVAMLDSPF